jgi:hypothetical protein
VTRRGQEHAKTALRLWRRHKTRAVLFACLALAELGAGAAARSAGKARKAARKLRRRKRRKP